MRLHDVFGARLNKTRMVKNTARWAQGNTAKEPAGNTEYAVPEPQAPEPQRHSNTEPVCLNDIFADLINDNSAMGQAV